MRFRDKPVLDKSNGTVLTKQVPLCVFMCVRMYSFHLFTYLRGFNISLNDNCFLPIVYVCTWTFSSFDDTFSSPFMSINFSWCAVFVCAWHV